MWDAVQYVNTPWALGAFALATFASVSIYKIRLFKEMSRGLPEKDRHAFAKQLAENEREIGKWKLVLLTVFILAALCAALVVAGGVVSQKTGEAPTHLDGSVKVAVESQDAGHD